MRLLRLVRKWDLVPPKLFDVSDIWALDTPSSRAALENLVGAGNRQLGLNSHWIEVQDPDPPASGLIT
jgi:hypothetical protein